ncbi:MAG TPA: hypothetical protein VNM68_10820, partial [Candidatus Polarisedimenticolia bacterium]|nr:hypothetical protein [Candidatus Polarisedimenticolia bacterium]
PRIADHHCKRLLDQFWFPVVVYANNRLHGPRHYGSVGVDVAYMKSKESEDCSVDRNARSKPLAIPRGRIPFYRSLAAE